MDFKERKEARIEYYEKHVKGWKDRPCGACNGSGYYDHNGSPKCGACNGTGKEKYKPNGTETAEKAPKTA
jgi:DnaJ-class molecular chaperone